MKKIIVGLLTVVIVFVGVACGQGEVTYGESQREGVSDELYYYGNGILEKLEDAETIQAIHKEMQDALTQSGFNQKTKSEKIYGTVFKVDVITNQLTDIRALYDKATDENEKRYVECLETYFYFFCDTLYANLSFPNGEQIGYTDFELFTQLAASTTGGTVSDRPEKFIAFLKEDLTTNDEPLSKAYSFKQADFSIAYHFIND